MPSLGKFGTAAIAWTLALTCAAAIAGFSASASAQGLGITHRAPDPDNWTVSHKSPEVTVYTCKPDACPSPASVTVTMSPSPARDMDPLTLQKFAKVDYPREIEAANAAAADRSDKVETLTAESSMVAGLPAVLNETRYATGSNVTFIATGLIFVGPVMATIQSVSPDRALAMKSLNGVLDQFSVGGGAQRRPQPPAAPPAPAAPPVPERRT